MDDRRQTMLSIIITDSEFEEIKNALEKFQYSDAGKIRQGDLVRTILLEWARKNNKSV